MKKQTLAVLGLLLLCVKIQFVFSINEEPFDPDRLDSGGRDEIVIYGLIGGAETLLLNGFVMSFNIFFYNNYVKEALWTIPTAESVHDNFTSPGQWEEQDDFIVNQIGHPYHGSMYFNTGRLNGFGFYESAFFSALGSYTWETLGENNRKSVNDLITTFGASLPLGEMLYRLYLEACAAGIPSPLTVLINPTAAAHRFATGWKLPKYGGNIYGLRAYAGMLYAQTDFSASSRNGRQEVFSFRGPAANIGFSVIYGNPFEQDTRVPFKHFEFSGSAALDNGNYLGLRFISDGYLFSFSPVYTDTDLMSTGLSLHMDSVAQGKFANDSTIDQFSSALDWTIKYQHIFRGGTVFQGKFHVGFTYMGVSEYYAPYGEKKDLKNYGAGLNGKYYFNLEHEKLGKLEMSVFHYVLWNYAKTSAVSQATVHWLFLDATYSHPITEHLSLGITDSFALERGSFDNFPDTWKNNNEVKVFLAWDL